MTWRRLPWKVCCEGGRFCIHLLDTLLILLACGLTLIIAFLHLAGTVPLPPGLADVLRERFENEGIHVEWDQARIDPWGRLLMDGLRVKEAREQLRVFSATHAWLDLDLFPHLLLGDVELERLSLTGASLFMPPEFDGGSPEDPATLSIHHATLSFLRGGIQLDGVHLAAGKVQVFLEGLAPAPGEDPSADRLSLAEAWRNSAEDLASLLEQLHSLPATVVDLHSAITEEERWTLDANVSMPTLRQGDIELRELLIQLRELDLSGRAIHRPVNAHVRELTLQRAESEPWKLHNLRLFARGAPTEGLFRWRMPEALWSYGEAELDGLRIPSLSSQLELRPLPSSLSGSARASSPDFSLRVAGTQGIETAATDLQFSFIGDPETILGASLLLDGQIGRETNFSPLTRLEAQLTRSAEDAPFSAAFEAQLFGLRVREARFDEVRLTAEADPDFLRVGPIRVHDPGGEWADGFYIHRFSDHSYRIAAEGAVAARRLDSLLPSFYRRLWDLIDPGIHPVAADVDVRARWGDTDAANAWVSVDGRELAYSGVPVDHAHVRLRQAAGFVELLRLEAISPEGSAMGSVALTFPPEALPEIPPLRRIQLTTELPLHALSQAFGEAFSALDRELDFTEPPRITIDGDILAFRDRPAERQLAVSVLTRQPFSLRGANFDELEAQLHFSGDEIRVDPIHATAGSGSWRASVHLQETAAAETAVGIVASGRNLPYGHFLEVLNAASNREQSGFLAEGPPPSGRVDMEVQLGYTGDPLSTLSGQGHFSVLDAQLGRLYLLGGLSRSLSSIGINLAAFKLDKVESHAEFSPGRLSLPDLAISGPSIRIEMPGSIAMPSTELDLSAKVFFLETEEATLRSLLSPILHPLGHVFELAVTGPLEDPSWSMVNNPFNFFRSRSE